MRREVMRRVRWGNVGVAGGTLLCLAAVILWPRLSPAGPRLPSDAARYACSDALGGGARTDASAGGTGAAAPRARAAAFRARAAAFRARAAAFGARAAAFGARAAAFGARAAAFGARAAAFRAGAA